MMFNSQKIAQNSIFFSVVILFIINQVSTLECYDCFSEFDEDCIAKPAQQKFIAKCNLRDPAKDKKFPPLFSTFSDGLNQLDLNFIKYQCTTYSITNITSAKVSLGRGCIPKHINDESWTIMSLTYVGFQLNGINRCDESLCNENVTFNVLR
ncbi:uncharacterized protein LOC131670396 [Phymastichus coffea]|uniref:uncharacterized protein LOC131670396 n=1 Tax=Phymastichus coffea TaxID=108790 RepID=UPI00273A9ACC|nr:uncharacterized protein LOC131670396 [Phymastichus coffea]